MPLIKSNYDSIKLLSNGHIQTILPFLFRTHPQTHLPYDYVIEHTCDGDEIETFYTKCDNPKGLVILTHGLEGDARDCYFTSFTNFLNDHGFSVLTWNMRTCGGKLNKTHKFYHALQYSDLSQLVEKYSQHYSDIHLVGVSLGGVLTANYLSREHSCVPKNVKKACLISTPLHLCGSSRKLESIQNRFFYQRVFTRTMKNKVLKKHKHNPLPLDIKRIKKAKWLRDFDDLVIAPIYGFKNGKHYRETASPLNHIKNLKIPTYILNSKDDPFLSKESYPTELAMKSKHIFLETPNTGGHVGFIRRSFEEHYWYELRVLDFITQDPQSFQ